ncbi:MAG: hypothetical protein HEQ29_11630 [Dolichospermum sp. LBC05a]|nr:hypothetical protein [Dolichospermum sp. OL01]MCO5797397.1 hypothetical protein [Dolichospermum sp. OL03]MCS6280067.1 hypothetical protein [Dolichospermum sp.]QSV58923.1 MAG: hypothetical protein HEQ29_11630 [Dolichospermum sp. LBC05a]
MLTQAEFEEFINDTTKQIDGNILWIEDEDHSPAVEFRVELTSNPDYPIFVKGSYNPLIKKLTYALIHRAAGRIYALDLGQDHKNPDGNLVGEKHKHRWREPYRDKEAYVPEDITALVTDPVKVWQQFCLESKIKHNGIMQDPPPLQLDLFL